MDVAAWQVSSSWRWLWASVWVRLCGETFAAGVVAVVATLFAEAPVPAKTPVTTAPPPSPQWLVAYPLTISPASLTIGPINPLPLLPPPPPVPPPPAPVAVPSVVVPSVVVATAFNDCRTSNRSLRSSCSSSLRTPRRNSTALSFLGANSASTHRPR